MKLHQIRNATIVIEYNGIRFLIDPMFAPKEEYPPIIDKPWPLHNLPVPPKDILKNINAIIITHLHTYHFDKYAQDILPKNIKIFVQDIFDKNALEKEHFNNIEVVKPEGTEFEGIYLYKSECRHGVRELVEPLFLANGMRWEAMGVVFKSETEPTLYLTGDTLWFDGVKNALDTHKPEYTIVNPAYTQIGMNYPTIMGIEDLKVLHEYAPDTKIIASHMDSVSNASLNREDIRKSDVSDYVYLPADGEIMLLN